jgi:integrase
MANKISFILKDKSAKEETLIMLRYTCADGKFPYSTQQFIQPSDWNEKVQRSYTNTRVNDELNRLYRIVESYIESQKRMGIHEIFKQDLKRELDQKEHRVKAIAAHTIFDYIDILISEAEEGTLLIPKKHTRYSAGTLKNWRISRDMLKQYNPHMTFEAVTIEMYHDFINFMNRRNYSKNYTGKFLKDWINFMGLGQIKQWHQNMVYKHPLFVKIREDIDTIYLDEDEIQTLLNHDLSDHKYYETIRDRFICNLYTGFRVSDMHTFNEENIEDGMIVHINQKTGKKVAIPIHPIIEEIITKYGGKLPKQYCDQVVNREIKEIAKQAGFTQKFRYTKTIGGKKKQFIKEKWELVTNHTCRRSLTTNLLKHVGVMEAKDVVGMSLKTLELYNKRSVTENANLLKNNSFFKK